MQRNISLAHRKLELPHRYGKTRLFLASVYRVGMPAPFLPSPSKLSTTIFLYLSIVILVVEADASLLLSAYSPSEQFLGRLFESFIG